MKYLLAAFLIYLAWQFIFNLVIPVFRASRRLKKAFREMAGRMQDYPYTGKKKDFAAAAPSGDPAGPGDYIEFEEIRD